MFDLTAVYLLVFQVEFTSLDFLLHTKALLSTINFLNSAVPPQFTAARDQDAQKKVEKTGAGRTGESRLFTVCHYVLSKVLYVTGSGFCALCSV